LPLELFVPDLLDRRRQSAPANRRISSARVKLENDGGWPCVSIHFSILPFDAGNPSRKKNAQMHAHLQCHAQKFWRTKAHVSTHLAEIDKSSFLRPRHQFWRKLLSLALRTSSVTRAFRLQQSMFTPPTKGSAAPLSRLIDT
jgi:hypothetical protein